MPPPTHLRSGHALYPTAAQRQALDARWALADHIWRVLSVHAQREAAGERPPLADTAARFAAGRVPAQVTPGPPTPRRSVAERRRELEDVARRAGWRELLGSATLDGLVRDVARVPGAPALPADLGVALGSLAHPLDDLHVEIVGVPGAVLAPLYLLPGPALAAVQRWRGTFADHLTGRRVALEARVLAGDAEADAAYVAHLARYGESEGALRRPLDFPAPEGSLRLELAEATRLHRTPEGYRVSWAFRPAALPPARDALIALDPGQRQLWTWVTAGGHGHVPHPPTLPRPWEPAAATAGTSPLRRPHDLTYAHLGRHHLLYTARVRPQLEALLARCVAYAGIALEATTLPRMARLGLDYAPFVAYANTRTYELFLGELAAVDASRTVLWIPPDGTTADCSVCGAPGSMRYWHRVGRCRRCRARLDRDLNGARNIYRRALDTWAATGRPWTPAPLPAPRRRPG